MNVVGMKPNKTSKPINLTLNQADDNNRFLAYFQYICTLSNHLDSFGDGEIIQHVTKSNSFSKIQSKTQVNYSKIAELLRNSWYTEEQINISSKIGQPEYSNHWTPIQMYYAAYLMIRALELAKNTTEAGDHSAALRFMSSWINSNPDIFPAPWGMLCSGHPEEPIFKNMPDGVILEKVSAITRPWNTNFYDSYTMFLKTTRGKVLKKIIDDYKARHRIQRISPAKKKEFIENLAPTNFFHCLYRLRLRSNYEDADSFISSIGMRTEASMMSAAICNITSKNHVLLEILICRYIGKSKYIEIVRDFARTVHNSQAASRLEMLSQAY
jgi:hypothetical protein